MRKYMLSCLLNFILVAQALASTPLLTFTPLTPTTVVVRPHTNENVRYLITNQSFVTHNLLVNRLAFNIETSLPNSCGAVFTLGYKESCILDIIIRGIELDKSFRDGPVVCESGGELLCYEPREENILTVIYKSFVLSSDKQKISFVKNDVSSSVTIKNNSSKMTAYNIHADLIKAKLDKYLKQNASDCKVVLPKQSCTIYLERLNGEAVAKTHLEIRGENTENLSLTVKADDY